MDGVKIGEMKIFKRSWHSGRNYSKLTTSLINILLKFQTLISQVYQCFLFKKRGEAFALQTLCSLFFVIMYQCIWL